MGDLSLSKEQQLAFNRLKKAYKDCDKLGVVLINQYGTLNAYNGRFVTSMGDKDIPPQGTTYDYYEVSKYIPSNIVNGVDPGRADDDWIIGFTEEGSRIIEELKTEL